MHGEVKPNGEFKFRWDKISEAFYGQDVKNAKPTFNNVSLHEITEDPFAGPIYHAGVDTIDSFSHSWHKKLTEEELDRAYENFCKV